jgi:hypothetical protein
MPLVALITILSMALGACGGDSADTTTTTEAAAVQTILAISADVVWGPLNIPEDERGTQVCVLGNRFPRNSEIVWRARVTDPVTGEPLTDETASVEVQLSDGQVLEMRYGPHPRDNPTDFFWTTSFDIPADYPTGTLGYEIAATANDGRTGTFSQFQVAPSLLTITDEVLETIEEG